MPSVHCDIRHFTRDLQVDVDRGSIDVADPSGRRNPRCTNEATRNVSAIAPTNVPNDAAAADLRMMVGGIA
jgi:hypothetical protein